MRRIVVVGASVAGHAAVDELRGGGFDGEIVLVGAETAIPYDRPPLSKQVLAAAEEDDAHPSLRPSGWALDHGLDLRLGAVAIGLDPRRREVELSGGERLAYDGLMIATGAAARPMPGPELGGVHVLRTIEDARAIRAGLDRGARLAIIGGGFIGAEVAATARGRGAPVTLLEATPAPLSRVFGELVGGRFARLHAEHGVELRLGVPVAGLEGSGRVERLRLADGSAVDADLVVVGLGARPNTDWLSGSGIALEDGISCDERCRTSAPGIVAAGDVARWRHPRLGVVRIEHWENAVLQGQAAARSLIEADPVPFAPVPYVWSDQYGHKFQLVGRPLPGDEVVPIEGDIEAGAFTVAYGRGGRLTAVLSMNRRAAARRARRLLRADVPLASAIEEFEISRSGTEEMEAV